MLTLSGNIHIALTADKLYDDLACAMLGAAEQAVEESKVFHLALSGGLTPERFYMRLVTDPRFRALPWKQTHIWLADERCVPESDERSNIRMIRETLMDHVPTPKRCVHAIPVLAQDPATAYEDELRQALAGQEVSNGLPVLDFVLLGMGEDGHTASLFPHSPALTETNKWIMLNDGPAVALPPRVTMTYPLLNAARQVAVLVTGSRKKETLQRVDQQLQETGPDVKNLPITGIDPSDPNGVLTWFLDTEAVE